MCVFWGSDLELNVLFMEICWMALRLCIIKDLPFYWGHPFRQMCVCWSGHMNTAHPFSEARPVRIGWFCSCQSLIGYSNCPSLYLFVFVAVMRRNPFAAEGCCRKGSRNALQELYNPTQVPVRWTHISLLDYTVKISWGKNNTVKCGETFFFIQNKTHQWIVHNKIRNMY